LLATLTAAGGDRRAAVAVGDHHNDVAAAVGAAIPCIFALWGYGRASDGANATAKAASFSEAPEQAFTVMAGFDQ
jgi:phosphoglycolate phosphatase